MHVTDYELFEVPPRWVFLKIETNTGLAGWGEPIVEGHAKTTMTAVEEIMDNYLIGKNPLEIERHWQAIYRGRHFRRGPILMSSLAGVDQALWDIKGRHYGAPVFELLGGRARDRIRTYQWIGGETSEDARNAAVTAVDNGYRTLKLALTAQTRRIDSPSVIDAAAARLAAVRDAVGSDVDIAVDFRGRVARGMAKQLAAALDPYDPLFYEEPVLPEQFGTAPGLERHTKTPLASGERLYSRWEFQPVMQSGLVDVIQPDPSHAGGITEVKRIANAAEALDVAVAPHCALGPTAFASCLHVSVSTPSVFVQSQNLDVHQPDDNDLLAYLDDPSVFGFKDGYVEAPTGPGLGIDVDESFVREQSNADVNWQNPIWYYEDGSVAEW